MRALGYVKESDILKFDAQLKQDLTERLPQLVQLINQDLQGDKYTTLAHSLKELSYLAERASEEVVKILKTHKGDINNKE